MVWLPDGEKIFEDMFLHFDYRIHVERDRRTPFNGIRRAFADASASRRNYCMIVCLVSAS